MATKRDAIGAKTGPKGGRVLQKQKVTAIVTGREASGKDEGSVEERTQEERGHSVA